MIPPDVPGVCCWVLPDGETPPQKGVCAWLEGGDDPGCKWPVAYHVKRAIGWWFALCAPHTALARQTWPDIVRVINADTSGTREQ